MKRESGLRANGESSGVGWAAYPFGAASLLSIQSEFDGRGE
jgi:hypothetical protein